MEPLQETLPSCHDLSAIAVTMVATRLWLTWLFNTVLNVTLRGGKDTIFNFGSGRPSDMHLILATLPATTGDSTTIVSFGLT